MEPATRTPILQVILLFMAGLCAGGQFSKVGVLFSQLRAVYPEAGPEIGFLVSLLSLVGIVLGLVAGLLVARVGFRRLLLVALFGGALISLYQSSLPPLPLMLISRAIEGLSQVAIVVAAPTLVAALTEKRHQPPVMALWSTIFGLAFALTTWFGLPLAAIYGPASVFQAHAALMAVVGVLLLFFLPQKGLPGPRPGRLSIMEIVRRHAEVYTSPAIAAPAAGFIFYTLTYVSLLTLLPDYIAPEWRALTASMMPLASIIASLVSGATLLRRFSAISVLLGGFAAGAAIALALIVFPGDPVLCVTLFVAIGLVQSASFVAIPELNAGAEHQALANGAVAQAGNLGNTFGTPVLLAAASAGGFAALAGMVALAQLSGVVVHFALRRARART